MTAQPALEFRHVSKTYSTGSPAVDDVSFAVAQGEFAVILGPSGCGKTTLLKMVNRLQEPSAGEVLVGGRDTRAIEPTALRRSIGYVIQQVGLFPHMTVAQNVAVVPELLGWHSDKIQARLQTLLELVRLPFAEYGVRYPAELSGGQQQRVGLARALGADPGLLLMDEPFGALDAIERARLQSELAGLQRQLGKTVVFVTHDVDEALRLADRIVIMRSGKLVQADKPHVILARPADSFVAELVNSNDVVRRMSVICVREVVVPAANESDAAGPVIDANADLRNAFSQLLLSGSDSARVADENRVIGRVTIDRILESARTLGVDR